MTKEMNIPGLGASPLPGEVPGLGALRAHLFGTEYLVGVDEGQWKVLKVAWPIVIATVTAGDGNVLGLRLEITGYPTAAPAGAVWDVLNDVALPTERLPEGPWATETFRGAWSAKHGNAPYLACDREAITDHHPGWAQQNPGEAWHANRTIVHYLRVVHRVLAKAKLPGDPQ